MNKILVIGQPNVPLAQSIATACHADFFPIIIDQFADTSMTASFSTKPDCAGADVLLVYQFAYVHDGSQKAFSINDQLFGIFQLIDLVRQMKACSISVVMPSLAYARQDVTPCKQYQGFVFSLGNLFKALGVKHLVACQLHTTAIIDSFPVHLEHCSLEPLWKVAIEKNILSKVSNASWCVVSPDKGGAQRAQALASLLDLPSAVIHKTRVAQDAAISYELVGDVAGKHIILFDDIIDTGRTAISACDLLLAKGAVAVYGCMTHAVFSQGTIERLESSRFQEMWVTNSLIHVSALANQKLHVISLDDFVAHYVSTFATKQLR